MKADALPLPRLQLTWEPIKKPRNGSNWKCRYELLLPVGEHDIRNTKNRGYLTLRLGGTLVGSERGPVYEDGTLGTPFRDGAHAKWDAEKLGLPAFVVYGDLVRQLTVHSSDVATGS